jgi:hypothetical protein
MNLIAVIDPMKKTTGIATTRMVKVSILLIVKNKIQKKIQKAPLMKAKSLPTTSHTKNQKNKKRVSIDTLQSPMRSAKQLNDSTYSTKTHPTFASSFSFSSYQISINLVVIECLY